MDAAKKVAPKDVFHLPRSIAPVGWASSGPAANFPINTTRTT